MEMCSSHQGSGIHEIIGCLHHVSTLRGGCNFTREHCSYKLLRALYPRKLSVVHACLLLRADIYKEFLKMITSRMSRNKATEKEESISRRARIPRILDDLTTCKLLQEKKNKTYMSTPCCVAWEPNFSDRQPAVETVFRAWNHLRWLFPHFVAM